MAQRSSPSSSFLPSDLLYKLGLVIVVCAAAGHLLILSFVPDAARERRPRLYLIPKEGRYPDAVVVGVKKCGTKALTIALSTHPDVAICKGEIHFFDHYYERGFGWYLTQLERFALQRWRKKYNLSQESQPSVLMEKTPAYFVTQEARVGLKRMNSKVIIILCHPVRRALSEILMTVEKKTRKGKDKNITIEEAIHFKVLDPETGEVNPDATGMNSGIYSQHLSSWMDAFSLGEELLIVDGDKLKQRPWEEVERVQDFLGIPQVVTSQDYYLNETKGFYCLRQLGCLKDGKGHKNITSVFSQYLLDKLTDFFRPHNEAVSRLLNRTFDWE